MALEPGRRVQPATIEMVRGDISRATTDAIVNAANSSLLGGGGVDGAIHRAGGPSILEECQRIRLRRGSLPAGEAVITGSGALACRHVIHTVGPVWSGGGRHEAETLTRCYRASLAIAAEHGLSSISFPSISTGAFGYPVAEAAAVAVTAVRGALAAPSSLELVRFVLFSDADLAVYQAALEKNVPSY